ncbi:MAG TPA: grasp-with-spasm system ATP-grasp peptide maturase [Thermoanaerobaculia bacterium]|nr:grasp-with-spasm system ATP-grasp peptide maturase [Thermoanaerobaculia bacterium]
MILILSQADGEPTTEWVMDWLDALGVPFLRLNGEDLDGLSGGPGLSVRIDAGRAGREVAVNFAGPHEEPLPFPAEAVTAVWYRRWQASGCVAALPLLPPGAPDPRGAAFTIRRHLSFELWKLSETLFSRFAAVPWLSDPAHDSPNKLKVLETAAHHGLEVPATLVTTRRHDLERFAERHGTLITKSIGEPEMFFFEKDFFMLYTAEVGPEEITALPDRFFPSLFQERLEKKYEIRVFFLDGRCYPMAIFSQLDARTQVDFRRYNRKRPNRTVPYRLPAEIEAKIAALMASLELETGSLDLIRTPDGRHVFLEVNPIGQFGMVSRPCNYFLERRVAEVLARKGAHVQT